MKFSRPSDVGGTARPRAAGGLAVTRLRRAQTARAVCPGASDIHASYVYPFAAMDRDYLSVAKALDHALLKPTLTDAELAAGCQLAREHQVASVCIVPHALRRCAELLAGSGVEPSTTIGFPHGAAATRVKVVEAEQALADGGTELDMVVNIGKVLGGDRDYVRAEIGAVLAVTRGAGKKLKVIFENAYLGDGHKRMLCELCSELAVDWVKTSTGFGPSGANLDDLRLMREHTPPSVQVKASGGIRSLAQVRQILALGVSRIGTSSTSEILAELRSSLAHRA
ncbi:MAG TPA: deoxyribose-phosphate aldolase [Polyangiaceae bacterium]|nr:deoxyribose-phosphate aldolase [Polyangiaceae bacterium]